MKLQADEERKVKERVEQAMAKKEQEFQQLWERLMVLVPNKFKRFL